MNALARSEYWVKEHIGLFKSANNFDIHDSLEGQVVLECREEKLGFFTKLLRFTDYKRYTPFQLEIKEPGGPVILQVKRGVSFFLSTVNVTDQEDRVIGKFKQKFFSIGGKFDVLGPDNEFLCSLKGKWTGWNFSFGLEGVEFANVSKKWSGFGKEMLTSADNYRLSIDPSVSSDSPLRPLILSAVLCIDMVLKE